MPSYVLRSLRGWRAVPCPVTIWEGARAIPSRSGRTLPVPVLLGGEQGRQEGQEERGTHSSLLSGFLSSRIIQFFKFYLLTCQTTEAHRKTLTCCLSVTLAGFRRGKTLNHSTSDSVVFTTRWGPEIMSVQWLCTCLRAPGHVQSAQVWPSLQGSKGRVWRWAPSRACSVGREETDQQQSICW